MAATLRSSHNDFALFRALLNLTPNLFGATLDTVVSWFCCESRTTWTSIPCFPPVHRIVQDLKATGQHMPA